MFQVLLTKKAALTMAPGILNRLLATVITLTMGTNASSRVSGSLNLQINLRIFGRCRVLSQMNARAERTADHMESVSLPAMTLTHRDNAIASQDGLD